MPLARGLILILRLPLLVLIAVGALVVVAATRIDDWLRSWRSSFVRRRSVVVPLPFPAARRSRTAAIWIASPGSSHASRWLTAASSGRSHDRRRVQGTPHGAP